MENHARLNWQDTPGQRLSDFREFRVANQGKSLEHCVQATIEFYRQLPIGSMAIDPYDSNTWLNIWQMIDSNDYCDFNRALLYAYTLHYLGHPCEVQVGKTNNNHYMLCMVGDYVLNYRYNEAVDSVDWQPEQKYSTHQLCG